MKLVTFDHILTVPITYARAPVAPYGTMGKGPRSVRLEVEFHRQLEACLRQLWEQHSWGKPKALVSGGCYVQKAGRHGEGRAIDIDALWWQGTKTAPKARPLVTLQAPQEPVLYLGVEAVLRQHFGTVLNYWFGHGHEDHWHVDNGQLVAWTGKPPTVHCQTLFLQAALRYVWLTPNISIDGALGQRTRGGLRALGYSFSAKTATEEWPRFLDATAKHAFSRL